MAWHYAAEVQAGAVRAAYVSTTCGHEAKVKGGSATQHRMGVPANYSRFAIIQKFKWILALILKRARAGFARAARWCCAGAARGRRAGKARASSGIREEKSSAENKAVENNKAIANSNPN